METTLFYLKDKTEMADKIFVGFTTRAVPENLLKTLMPEFQGRAGTADKEKIAKQIQDKEEAWKVEAANMPYTGTFDSVHLIVPAKELAVTFKHDGRQPFGDKPSISQLTRNFLLKHFKGAWSNEANYRGEHDAIFVGFNPRRFLKMFGIECSLPRVDKPLPLSLWYGNSDHRDIEEALMPKDFKLLDWSTVIRARSDGMTGDDLEKYNAILSGWSGPGSNAEQDANIAMMMASQLGFLE